jgi:hypothetical protein
VLLVSSGIVDAVAPVNSTAAAYDASTADTSTVVVAVGDSGTESGQPSILTVAVPSLLAVFMPEVAGHEERSNAVSMLQDPSRLNRHPFDAGFAHSMQQSH